MKKRKKKHEEQIEFYFILRDSFSCIILALHGKFNYLFVFVALFFHIDGKEKKAY